MTSVPPERLPDWLAPLARACQDVDVEQLSRFVPDPDADLRRSAVLILFGQGTDGPDILLIERAGTLREHAGQPAFPGGGVDAGDTDVIDTALREATEETGLARAGVDIFAVLPALLLPVTSFSVTPVLGWWREPGPVGVVDEAEVAAVLRAPIAQLTDPARRGTVRHPSGFLGPGFEVGGLLVWGFTAGLLSGILELGGFTQPWDDGRRIPFPAH